jgi:hypothetical protein
MLIETQVVRSKSELMKELQGLPVTTAVMYRNVDRKAWEQIAKEHPSLSTCPLLLSFDSLGYRHLVVSTRSSPVSSYPGQGSVRNLFAIGSPDDRVVREQWQLHRSPD